MISNNYWDKFCKESYGSKPCVINLNELSFPGFKLGDAVDAAISLLKVRACNWTDGNARRLTDVELPIDLEGSLQDFGGFLRTVREINGFNEFFFSQHNCHALVPRLQNCAASFLQPLFQQVGLPSNGVNIIFLAGHYHKTPAGLHNDPADIFLFPLLGKKTLLTWPHSYWDPFGGTIQGKIVSKRLPDIKYSEHMENCELLQASPGQALYFPAGTWHINEFTSPSDSVALAISVFKNQDIRGLMESISGRAYEYASRVSDGAPTWKTIEQACTLFAKLNYLQRLTSMGFVTGLRKSAEDQVSAGLLYRAKSNRLAFIKEHNTHFIVANGHICTVQLTHEVDELLNTLSGGNWVSGNVLSKSNIAGFLISSGALEIQNP